MRIRKNAIQKTKLVYHAFTYTGVLLYTEGRSTSEIITSSWWCNCVHLIIVISVKLFFFPSFASFVVCFLFSCFFGSLPFASFQKKGTAASMPVRRREENSSKAGKTTTINEGIGTRTKNTLVSNVASNNLFQLPLLFVYVY